MFWIARAYLDVYETAMCLGRFPGAQSKRQTPRSTPPREERRVPEPRIRRS